MSIRRKPLKMWEEMKLEKGECLGTVPFGYGIEKSIRRSKYPDPGIVFVDEKTAEIVRYVFYLYSSGTYSLSSLVSHIQNKYKCSIHRSHIARMLKNKFYYGVMVWKGHKFDHRYEKLTTKSLFDQCQRVLHYNNRHTLIGPQPNGEDCKFNTRVFNISKNELLVCKSAIEFISIDAIVYETGLSLFDVQGILFDLTLKGAIHENEFGEYKVRTITE